MKRTINAFVSELRAFPVEITAYLDASRSFIATPDSSITVHTGLGTFELPWPLDETMPAIGASVLLTIEVPE